MPCTNEYSCNIFTKNHLSELAQEDLPVQLERDKPNASFFLFRKGHIRAQCSLWWKKIPSYQQEAVGLLGHFEADNYDSASQIIEAGLRRLNEENCKYVFGPMDGSTWKRYRYITERGHNLPFFMEPDNPDSYPLYFQAAGFEAIYRYCSAASNSLLIIDRQGLAHEKRLLNKGIYLRSLKVDSFEEELRKIYAVCLEAFSNNPFYSRLSFGEFLEQYVHLQQFIDSKLVLIAEQEGKAVGFILLIPDLKQSLSHKKGASHDTVIVKTIARLPLPCYAGLGTVLVSKAQEAAYQAGYRKVIHALMQENNQAARISAHSAQVMRRYALFGRKLKP